MTELLRTDAVTKIFGGLVAVNQVDMKIKDGQILGLIGPNGAGKTTLFNVITGLYPASSGNIYFKGEDITRLSQANIVPRGMCRTFQVLRIFRNMSVLDNVLVGMQTQSKGSVLDALLQLPSAHQEERRMKEQAMHYLDLLGLTQYADTRASSLSYGDQRRVEVARALAAEPDLLLLDEPSAGMNIAEAHKLTEFIKWIRTELKKTILLIEHNMRVVMPIADHVVVLNQGKKIFEGTPEVVQDSREVIEAYLGKAYLRKIEEKEAHA
jgi:branched-chain amino acid transport system ATP-binding protein